MPFDRNLLFVRFAARSPRTPVLTLDPHVAFALRMRIEGHKRAQTPRPNGEGFSPLPGLPSPVAISLSPHRDLSLITKLKDLAGRATDHVDTDGVVIFQTTTMGAGGGRERFAVHLSPR